MPGEEIPALHDPAFLRRQILEIMDGDEMNIRRVVPLIWKQRGLRHLPTHQHGLAHSPVTEIRKCHDRPPSNAQHLSQDFERMTALLQRLAENHVIEGAIRIVCQTFVDIALIRGYTARDCSLHLAARDLNAARFDTFVRGQPLQQFTLAAAEVEHTRARLDNFPYDCVIAASEQFANKSLFWFALGLSLSAGRHFLSVYRVSGTSISIR